VALHPWSKGLPCRYPLCREHRKGKAQMTPHAPAYDYEGKIIGKVPEYPMDAMQSLSAPLDIMTRPRRQTECEYAIFCTPERWSWRCGLADSGVVSVVANKSRPAAAMRSRPRRSRPSKGPDMTCSRERLLDGRYQVSFVPRKHAKKLPATPPQVRRSSAQTNGRDRSPDAAKHAVSLSEKMNRRRQSVRQARMHPQKKFRPAQGRIEIMAQRTAVQARGDLV
jgi:hypothetical protein